uniref:Uncharacterized protein n=1 Tax=Paulinella chromatophora TaxID=39717 RepID=B1X5M8_PAUCH|nr:hypothetical protein PCC_0837 [Paulinella chromatophora]ACB43247.1 hypothetical protein PCC_0837 [Paulinella chromatophora]
MFFNRKDKFFLEFDQSAPNSKTLSTTENTKKSITNQTKPAYAKELKTSSKEQISLTKQSVSLLEKSNTINSSITTAEAIAIELRQVQDNLPIVSNVTFAPNNLQAGGTLIRGRRKPGANLTPFKIIANSMFKA